MFVFYDYSQGQAGKIDTVLQLDLSIMDTDSDYPPLDYDEETVVEEEFDWSRQEEVEDDADDADDAVLNTIDTEEVPAVDYDYDKSTEISQNVIVGIREDLLDMENEDIDREYQYVEEYDRIEEAMQVTMDNVHDQAMVFHIILLLGKFIAKWYLR